MGGQKLLVMATRIFVATERLPCGQCRKKRVTRAGDLCGRCVFDQRHQTKVTAGRVELPVYDRVHGHLDTIVRDDFYDVSDPNYGDYQLCE
jgi:hypothetical protein